jgi:hypothetical protein
MRDTDLNTKSTSCNECCEISDVKRKIKYIFKNIFIEIQVIIFKFQSSW